MNEFSSEEERKKYISESLKKDEAKRNKKGNDIGNFNRPIGKLLRDLGCRTAAENTENDDAQYAIRWILDLYELGKSMGDEYEVVEDGFYETAQSRIEISYYRLDKVFYYADVRENMNDWLVDFIGNGEVDDIDDIVSWGCFGMALDILRDSYENQ